MTWPSTLDDKRDEAWSSPGVTVDTVGPAGGGKQLKLVRRPVGALKASDFKVVETPVPTELAAGEALVQNILLSLDPTQRIWACEDKQYMPCVGLNTTMRAGSIGKVVKSSDESALAVGTYVSALGGVQDYVVGPIASFNPVVPEVPLSNNLSLFSAVIGLTAWVGTNICDPKPGKTIVISSAAGAVGSVAAQLCKLRGARVIGVAGGAAKGKMLLELGLDGAIDYKADDIEAKLKALAPDGIDSYFENTGGPVAEAVFLQMKTFGNVAFCGAIAGYNADGGQTMTMKHYDMVLMHRLKVQGFICLDHLSDIGTAMTDLATVFKAGKLKVNEHVVEAPIEDFAKTLNLLYTGGNTGKLIMKINPE